MTGADPTPAPPLLLGDAQWNRATRTLLLRGQPVKLPWRATAILSLLIEARGEVITREDLERQVWGDVQMDYSVLSQTIKTLRRALDPPPHGDSYIETVARVGYRLAVAVNESPGLPPPSPSPSWRRWAVPLALLLLLAALGLFVYNRYERRRQADFLVNKAFQLLRRGTNESGSQAGLLFREALLVIPNYSPANAGIAESAARVGKVTMDHALAQARLAVRDDPSCSECQSILGYILGVRMWRWKEAFPHLERAVTLNPSSASHRIYFAEWLMVHDRLAEAEHQAREATRLAPENPRVWSILAAVRFMQARYQDAIREGEKAASLDIHHPSAFLWPYHSFFQLGDARNGLLYRAKLLAAHHVDADRATVEYSGKFHSLLERSNPQTLLNSWITEVSSGRPLEVQRYNRALWFMWSGNPDAALAELEAGLKSRPYQMIYTAVDPTFAPLRTNPRFRAVVAGLGLR